MISVISHFSFLKCYSVYWKTKVNELLILSLYNTECFEESPYQIGRGFF
jgi:hypothetical protein